MSASFIPTSFEKLSRWAQANSLWTFTVTGGCCADEMLSAASCKYDLERFGCVPQTHPEQADLLIVSTAVTEKLAPEIKKIYDSMPHPKYVMAVGACANGGGAFSTDVSYCVKDGLDKIIPVDIYVPGCPPRPEAIMNGLIRLQEKICGSEKPRPKIG